MKLRSRRLTSLALAGSMIAGGGLALGAADAMAHDRQGATPAAAKQRAAKAGNGPVATAVRDTLGVTKDELRAAKRAGTSLATLAKEKGVERDTLVNAIATAIGKTTKGASLTSAQRTTVAERMVDRVPGQRASRANRGAGVKAAVQKAITSTLGVTASELRAARRAGTTPAELAQQKGVSRDSLVKAVAAAITSAKPANAPDLTEAQVTARAEKIVDNSGRGHGGPGMRGGRR